MRAEAVPVVHDRPGGIVHTRGDRFFFTDSGVPAAGPGCGRRTAGFPCTRPGFGSPPGLRGCRYSLSWICVIEPALGSQAPVSGTVEASTMSTNVPFTYLPSEFVQGPGLVGLPQPVITK
jgi:hypothetical protein